MNKQEAAEREEGTGVLVNSTTKLGDRNHRACEMKSAGLFVLVGTKGAKLYVHFQCQSIPGSGYRSLLVQGTP